MLRALSVELRRSLIWPLLSECSPNSDTFLVLNGTVFAPTLPHTSYLFTKGFRTILCTSLDDVVAEISFQVSLLLSLFPQLFNQISVTVEFICATAIRSDRRFG
jgi:hypothetical protein